MGTRQTAYQVGWVMSICGLAILADSVFMSNILRSMLAGVVTAILFFNFYKVAYLDKDWFEEDLLILFIKMDARRHVASGFFTIAAFLAKAWLQYILGQDCARWTVRYRMV